jgi:hypothetical protein
MIGKSARGDGGLGLSVNPRVQGKRRLCNRLMDTILKRIIDDGMGREDSMRNNGGWGVEGMETHRRLSSVGMRCYFPLSSLCCEPRAIFEARRRRFLP